MFYLLKNNSLREWSLRKAILIRTYSKYDPIPVPWNLFFKFAMLLLRFFKACRFRCGRRESYSLTTETDSTSEQEVARQQKVKTFDLPI